MTAKATSFIAGALWLCASITGASAAVIYTTGSGDGMAGRDWYSNPNYYWVDTASEKVQSYHDGGNRWSYRGAVIFDISSLLGSSSSLNPSTFNFYSFGFSGVTLQYANTSGGSVTTGYAQAGGTNISALVGGEGWQSFDVTSNLQSSVTGGSPYVSFIFNATVNYGGGSLASSEDALGRGAFLQVGSTQAAEVVPEPETTWLVGIGLACLIVASSKHNHR